MEINKTNESFSLKDSTDTGWNVTGSATNNIDGSFYLNLSVDTANKENNANIGYYNISVPADGMYNVNITVLPEYYSALTTYADTAFKIVQEYIKNQTSSEDK
jgi:hypothetical protein